AFAEEALNLDALLKTLEQGQAVQTEQNKAREADFRSKQDQQVAMLNALTNKRDGELNRSERLETTFEENEIKLQNLTDTLSKRMGSLKELFGVLQQVAGDSSNKFQTSVVSAQIPGRSAFMDEMAK
ncbi:energy transducer TonB, partial [Pseudoalteromonas ruthenica]